MKITNLSIKKQLSLLMLFSALVTVLTGFFLMGLNNRRMMKNDLVNNSFLHSKLIAEFCTTPLEFAYEAAASDVLENLKSVPDILFGAVLDKNGNVFAIYEKDNKQVDKADYNLLPNSFVFKDEYLLLSNDIISNESVIGSIYLKISTQQLERRLTEFRKMSLLLLFIVSILAYIISIYLQRFLSQPILHLADVTKKVSENANYSASVSTRNGSDEISVLYNGFNAMMSTIKKHLEERDSANNDLQQKTKELSETLENLKNTQNQLIQSEKMAALGQLIAGVAHEVNTPLGAIKSSVGNILENLQNVIFNLPIFLSSLNEKEKDFFNVLLIKSGEKTSFASAKEERKIKRNLVKIYESEDMENAYSIADSLVDMGIYENPIEDYSILKSDKGNKIIQYAYLVAGLSKSANNIQTATDKASKVVFALKSYARFDHTGEKRAINIIDSIETVITLYLNQIKRGIEVVREYRQNIPMILCYPDELNQVWTNIIHNSIQAMSGNGILKISIDCNEMNMIVTFEDNGVGIPEKIHDQIFEPFFTTKEQGEGSGLGLNIVRKIIDKHNGTISVKSKPGQTIFVILLPITNKI